MKKIVLIVVMFWIYSITYGQQFEDFDVFVKVKTTPLKNQQSSGTCWSFATTSFIETESLRIGKDPVILSPIFYVIPNYLEKSEKFIESKGNSYFAEGDLTFSVLSSYKKYGAIPESVYDGIIDGDWQHDHLEMDELLLVMVKSIGESGYGRIKPYSWRESIEAVLKAYLGTPPSIFNYKDKTYSPKSFADELVGINPDDYVEITSYSSNEFYEMFELNIPANWNNHKYLNVPISDFENIINSSLKNGFSLAWDGDATEPEFDFDSGILKLSNEQENIIITQELRQKTFDDKSTTDDHNMHIIGMAKDKKNKLYYLLKNSEGNNKMNGYIFMSKNVLLLKTISVLVHVDAIPTELKQKAKFDF